MPEAISHKINSPFTTESGFEISQPVVAYESWGELNFAKDNVVFICHALTGNSRAGEWFGGMMGAGKALDPEKHFIICPNILGSCYGTTGPCSINPETGKTYQANFPEITIRDIVRLNQQLLDELDLSGVELVVGGSLGGMTALEFAIMDDRVKKAAVFAMGKTHSPWAIGISHAQRKAIFADQNWEGGFYSQENPPNAGLAAARAMAMITYRAPGNYEQKFRREIHPEKEIYQVESYLDYQGYKLADRFDANSYVILSKAMDSHDVSRGRGSFQEVLGKLDKPILIVGIESDLLYPIHEQKELAELLPKGTFARVSSPYGHDAFLIEFDQINEHLTNFYHSLNTYTA
ncbi:MAG: homoserine O-acetyltransferase [Balneolaceae bacterium]